MKGEAEREGEREKVCLGTVYSNYANYSNYIRLIHVVYGGVENLINMYPSLTVE